MSLSDLAALGSFVSGLAVLLSLIFLYFQLRQIGAQIRQAEKNQKAAIGQGRTNRMVELALRTAEPNLNQAVINVQTNAPELKPQELFQFMHYMRALLLNAEDTYYQHLNGLLEDEPFQGFVTAMRATIANPPTQLMWQMTRPAYGPAFAKFVDGLVEQVPLEPLDVFDKRVAMWKEGVDALLAAKSF